jgi:hypothetical protein
MAILGCSRNLGTVKVSKAAETADTAQKPLSLALAGTRPPTESLRLFL